MHTDPTTRFLTGAEVARLFRASESTVRGWNASGRLHGVQVGRRILYDAAEVEGLIAAARDGARDGAA